ncbi:phosphatase 2C-like domain-containing protein [Halteromyces radiatus]|uniref:phosphatase 2C-like domain-containing protein n=1 Tax=Halteromyces radiatus TaxID=101107 RepID=UPI00221E9230|nr:phosphatase 2C-like domain-containing protein [Halteromyces radiatus]KAI8092573.1 phosphatase 2C-like domain-containing protein [Halteromyces radiatus]
MLLSQTCRRLARHPFNRYFTYSTRLSYEDYYLTRAFNETNLLRLHLAKSKHLIGAHSSRGTRAENEDRFRFVTLQLPEGDCLRTMKKDANRAYFGIFDGHGGPVVSDWLAVKLQEKIETVSLDDLPEILSTLRAYRGYFRRFPIPAVLRNAVDDSGVPLPTVTSRTDLSVEQRLTLGFLQADTECLQNLRNEKNDPHLVNEGSTGSVAILEPHDDKPFWESEAYDIIIGHVGDTRILLCDSNSGEAVTLTSGDHHPGNPIEHERLRKYAGFITTDSWGDDRILGMLATSRAFGDATLKRYGVSAEPDVIRHTITKDNPAAFMVLVTDGITSIMSDQEIVDFIKEKKDPTTAVQRLVDAADQLHSEDNVTAVVVRLKDWGTRMNDYTLDLRKYRLANSSMSNRQSW